MDHLSVRPNDAAELKLSEKRLNRGGGLKKDGFTPINLLGPASNWVSVPGVIYSENDFAFCLELLIGSAVLAASRECSGDAATASPRQRRRSQRPSETGCGTFGWTGSDQGDAQAAVFARS